MKLNFEGTVDIEGVIKLPGNLRKTVSTVFKGQHIKVTFQQGGKKRSNPQNNYLWGVVYEMITQKLNEQDPFEYTSEDIHHWMKEKFLREPFVNPDTGEVLFFKIGSTTDLTTKKFNEYIEKIRMWASKYLELYIPDPF